MAISGPPAPACPGGAGAAAVGEVSTGRPDAGDLIGSVPNREARQEMMKTLKATFDRIHLLSSMHEDLKRLASRLRLRLPCTVHGRL